MNASFNKLLISDGLIFDTVDISVARACSADSPLKKQDQIDASSEKEYSWMPAEKFNNKFDANKKMQKLVMMLAHCFWATRKICDDHKISSKINEDIIGKRTKAVIGITTSTPVLISASDFFVQSQICSLGIYEKWLDVAMR
ncbi:TPA: hypothetical protein RFU55_004979 [Klebsiella aerogenes]|nr:hypothetical protein [Klebsiella aerogenes]